MRKVEGFITSDGEFFEHEAEAEFREAENKLVDALNEQGVKGASLDRFCETSVAIFPIIERYVNAHKAINQNSLEVVSGPIEQSVDLAIVSQLLDSDNTYDAAREGDPSSIQFEPLDGRSTMSDVGRGASTEAVRDDSKGDGA